MVATPTLVTPAVGATATNVATASYTPTAGSLQIVIAGARRANTNASAAFTCTDGLGSTYTDLGSGTQPGVSPSARCQLFSLANAPATARAITVTSSNAANVCAIVLQVASGYNATITNIVFAGQAAGDPAPAMTAPATSSLVIAGGAFTGTDVSIGNPLTTSLFEGNLATGLNAQVSYTNGSGPSSATYNTTNTASVGFILEVLDFVATFSFPAYSTSRGPAMLDMLMR